MKRPNRRVMEAERFYRNYYKTAWGIRTPAKRGKRVRSSKSQVVMGALAVVTLLALLALPRISHAALNVDVFTTSQFPIVDAQAQSGATIHVYKLDGVKNTLGQINAGLQGLSPKFARSQAQSVLAMKMTALKQDFQGLMLAKQYGIQRLPAIVFNTSAQVIGQTDVGVAIQEYQSWQQNH